MMFENSSGDEIFDNIDEENIKEVEQ